MRVGAWSAMVARATRVLPLLPGGLIYGVGSCTAAVQIADRRDAAHRGLASAQRVTL